jgi:TolB-like protein
VKTPGYLSYGHLLHDPAWEPLRGYPRFQALTAALAPGAKAQTSSLAREEVTVEKSIAVLPFENLSAEPENAFFATGVQDAILTDLAKVADLKVLSRASVEQYSNQATRDMREISRALNVAHVIEGGVQRAGNRVRVTARLVDARSGEQKWAQSYDRELADVFSIQSQIAQTIVAQLQAKLLPREKAAIEVPPTRDPVAYDLFCARGRWWTAISTRRTRKLRSSRRSAARGGDAARSAVRRRVVLRGACAQHHLRAGSGSGCHA